MLNMQDYSDLSTEELIIKQKSLRNWNKMFIFIAVILVGITLNYVDKETNDMYPFLILGSLFLVLDGGIKLKKSEAEIEKYKN